MYFSGELKLKLLYIKIIHMKSKITFFLIVTLMLALSLTSCRTESTEFIQEPADETLQPGSQTAILMQQMSLNDGSVDNIIYPANCFNFQLPVTVVVNGTEITINTYDDLDDIEDLFEGDDDDDVVIQFPVTIILADFTEIIINSYDELDDFDDDCNDENEIDDDIECLDFVYPITASLFNTVTESINTITIENDQQMHNFIDDLDDDDFDNVIVTINFPISLFIYDGSQININNFNELVSAINTYGDECDEDDDYDFDDDCDNCTSNQVDDILTACSDWRVDELERDDDDLEDLYSDFVFNFLTNGTLEVQSSDDTFTGTWSTSGSGNSITLTINIPDLPDFNADWNVHEIEIEFNETKIDLEFGDDEFELKSNCN